MALLFDWYFRDVKCHLFQRNITLHIIPIAYADYYMIHDSIISAPKANMKCQKIL